MKSLAHKLLAFSFIIALATGCASVTDAGLDAQPEQPVVEQPQPEDVNSTEVGMSPIVDRPE